MAKPDRHLIPQTPDFRERVQESFARQKVMATLGAKLHQVLPGLVEIEIPFQDDLTQQHGFLHAGIITTVVDSACGYAAYSLMPPAASVLTVEYKANFLSPAKGTRFLARGIVVKAGRTLTICSGEVFAVTDAGDKLVATMSATMMTLVGQSHVSPG